MQDHNQKDWQPIGKELADPAGRVSEDCTPKPPALRAGLCGVRHWGSASTTLRQHSPTFFQRNSFCKFGVHISYFFSQTLLSHPAIVQAEARQLP